jgi:hypothetical protein
MNPVLNPFAPGAGSRPPELAGREDVLTEARVAIERAASGRQSRGMLLLGLRGVGKTVLLNEIQRLAAESGENVCLFLEAPEGRTLAEMMVPALRKALLGLSRKERAAARAKKGLAALRNFASVFKVKIGAVEIGFEPDPGVADSGDLDSDLTDLLVALAEAASQAETGVILIMDELQYLDSEELSALIVALHRIEQRNLPLIFFGAGLPQIAALAGEAKSYAERLFSYPSIGPLPPDAARDAIGYPLFREGVAIEERALDFILERTAGYPYFLQEWGSHIWNAATESPISEVVTRAADADAVAQLDRSFFRVRFERLSAREQDYLRAMAQLGAGPHGSGEIAAVLGQPASAVAPLRQGLIVKGMIYSPRHGETAFSVPMFDQFLRRTMPGWRPPEPPPRRTKRGRPPQQTGG